MLYPLDRLEDACKLSIEESSKLLVRARTEGDLDALADWTARSVYHKFIRDYRMDEKAALEATRALLSEVELDLKVSDAT